MHGLKKFGLVVSIILFGPLFLLSIFSIGFNKTLGNEQYTKQTIQGAGFYKAVGGTIVTQAVGESGGDPLITAALQSAVTGDKIQTALEPVITSTYAWLGGTVEKPTFVLEINPIKTDFQQSLTTALQARAASLPACSYANPPNGEDVYSVNCIPAGTDVNATINDAVSRVTNVASIFSNEVVADGSISSEEAAALGINDPTQNLPASLPDTYQFLASGQWFFVAGAFLTALGVIFLSKTWLFGLRNTGILLVINGLGLLILGLLLQFIVGSLVPTTSIEATELTVNAIEEASKIILADNASLFKVVGLVASISGVATIVASSVLISKQVSKEKPPYQKV